MCAGHKSVSPRLSCQLLRIAKSIRFDTYNVGHSGFADIAGNYSTLSEGVEFSTEDGFPSLIWLALTRQVPTGVGTFSCLFLLLVVSHSASEGCVWVFARL